MSSSRDLSHTATAARIEARPAKNGTCETCAHWSQVEPDWEYDALKMGKCQRIKQREDITGTDEIQALEWGSPERDAATVKALTDAKAIAVDGSGYYAALRTAGDFGCVLHVAAKALTGQSEAMQHGNSGMNP